MLCDSSTALLLSTMRVLCNEHFCSSDSSRIDSLAGRLMHENEDAILMKLVPLCA